MRNLPTLRQLQYLLTLHETKNFGRAAEKCNVTQPTLSAGIQEMESLLGLPVLDRSRRKLVVFTAFGLEVVETAKEILPQLNNILDKANRLSQPLSGPMRLGLIPTIAPYLLPKFLPHIQKKFPDIDFRITEDVSANLVNKLNNGQIDLAIMAFPYETKGLNQKLFFEEPFYCAAPKNTFKKGQNLHPDSLKEQKLLLLEDGHCLRDHALSASNLQNNHNQKSLSATSLHTLIQMVDQGYGVTLLPEMVINQGFMPKNIATHPLKKPVPTRKIGVLWRQKDPNEADIKTVIERLGQNLSLRTSKTLRSAQN